ncbi:MAG: SURF1 family protein [Parvularculaceae bacterium]|nr:SURF1 family protein [Parvularculaceae bacterium]
MTFHFRPALTAASLAALAILCSLGAWQLQRLAWKKELIAKTEARLAAAPIPLDEALKRAAAGEDLEYQPVFAEGAYRYELAALVFGTQDGKPGALVFTPLERRTSVLYVNRGFAPQDDANGAARTGPTGPVRVEGLFRSAEVKRGFEAALAPEDQPADNLYFARDPKALAAAYGLDVPAYYIDSFGSESAAPWPRGGLTRVEFSNRHFEYALTWFGLAGALVAVYFAYSVRRD